MRLLSMVFISIVFYHPAAFSADSEPEKIYLNGYLSTLQTVIDMDLGPFDSLTGGILIENTLHNRLNFFWDANQHIRFSAQMRNQLIYGDQIRLFNQAYLKSYENDRGFFDMSFNLFDGTAYVLNSQLDRLWANFTYNNLEITIGRQRINWGKTLVWNPNDIFNTYSFFTVDYPERPGSDAIRVQYYTGLASSIEAAVKMDSANNITFAGMINMNKWNYDFQVLGGILNSEDLTFGGGWSGYIGNTSFRGEMSYFHPLENAQDTSGIFLFSIEADYTFNNSLMLQSEILYADVPERLKSNDFNSLLSIPLSVKTMSIATWNILMHVSYPLTPLFNTSLNAMYFPDIEGYYAGPTFTYSLSDNIDISVYGQLFNIESTDIYGNPSRQNFNLFFLQIKGSF